MLEIVGATSTNKIFAIAFAYLGDEKEDNYMRALQNLRCLMYEDFLPRVVVIDRELVLMNALHNVFSTSSHILCR